jgi:hypothetical protein
LVAEQDEAVLVVHGISNRSHEAFRADTARMAEVLAPRRVVPVFWGDLGPRADFACIPRLSGDLASVLDAEPPAPAAAPTTDDELYDDTVRSISERAGETVPLATQHVVRSALASVRSRLDGARRRALTDVLTEAVLVSGPVGTAAVTTDETDDGAIATVGRRLRAIAESVDTGIEAWSQSVVSSWVRDGSAGLGTIVAGTVGDVLTYERHGDEIRGRLDTAYRAAAESERVHLLGHSLGALIAIEWLLGADVTAERPTLPSDRHLAKVVTFGAQVSLFCELHGLLTADGPTAHQAPVTLSARIERWYNVWHALDPLAFVMTPVLRLRNAAGEDLIEDLRLDPEGLGLSLSFHSSYWSDARFLAWLARTL